MVSQTYQDQHLSNQVQFPLSTAAHCPQTKSPKDNIIVGPLIKLRKSVDPRLKILLKVLLLVISRVKILT